VTDCKYFVKNNVILFPPLNMKLHHAKRLRRNATVVMAGTFDIRPPRDVLLNGPYKAVERGARRRKKKREREKRSKSASRALHKALLGNSNQHASIDGNFASTSSLLHPLPTASAATSSFWRARPTIHIPAIQRSLSFTPSPTSSPHPMDFTPGLTPGPSIFSSISRTSSKRPRTPADDEVIGSQSRNPSQSAPPRKKRVAVKRGWKGWVEGSPPPSQKLINLDTPVLQQQRRTRSGKNFDAIGVGKKVGSA
jgi:hypothetical protein